MTLANSSQPTPSRRLFIVPKSHKDETFSSGEFINLTHPRTGLSNRFLLDGEAIYEINCIEQEFQSWFVNDNIVKGGKLYMTTPIDPLFLILPILDFTRNQNQKDNSSGMFKPWDEIFTDTFVNFTELKQLAKTICDFKAIELEPDEITSYYRLNDALVYSWLSAKHKNICSFLKEKDMPDAHLVGYKLISEYLPTKWLTGFQEKVGISEKELTVSNKETKIVNTVSQINSFDMYEKSESIEEFKKAKVEAPKAKPIPPKGMLSLTSYFTKK